MMATDLATWADWLVTLAANLANLALSAMFLARSRRRWEQASKLGLTAIGIATLLAVGMIVNIVDRREWWRVVLPLPFLLVNLITLGLDFLYKIDFRSTVWIGPYLGLFYFGQMMLIGYAFATARVWGFVTLGSYFLCLFASLFAVRRVGHRI